MWRLSCSSCGYCAACSWCDLVVALAVGKPQFVHFKPAFELAFLGLPGCMLGTHAVQLNGDFFVCALVEQQPDGALGLLLCMVVAAQSCTV